MADYIVTGPDGKKYKMTADSPEAVDAAVQQMFGGASAPPAAPVTNPDGSTKLFSPNPNAPTSYGGKPPAAPERSLVDRIMGGAGDALSVATQGAAGLREGALNLAGLPVDLTAAIFGIDDPIGGGRSLNRIIPEAPAPQGATERVVRRVGEEIGATAVPVAGALGTAARIGVKGARELPTLARMFVEPAAVAPAKTAAKEFTAATAAGGVAGGTGEYSGKNVAEAEGHPTTAGQQLADVGGALAGYTLGSLGKKAAETTGTVARALTGSQNLKNEVAREIATDDIVRAAGLTPNAKGVPDTDELVDQLRDPNTRFTSVPNFKPTAGDVTGNPGLAAEEYTRQSGPAKGQFLQRLDENVKAVDDAMGEVAPSGQPGTFKTQLEIERNRRIGQASDAARTAEEQAAAATRPLTPQTTRGERGDIIRGEAEAARDVARQATRDAYDAADVNAVPLQPTFLAEALDRTTAGLTRTERTMAPQGLIDEIAQLPAGEPTTLREATSLRTRLIDQQRAALADPARRYEARVLGQYVEAVEDVIGQSVSAEQRALLDQARAARRAEAEAFELRGDPVAQITARNPGGVPKMRDENVATAATRDETIGRLLEEADTPATRAAIRDELLSRADTGSGASLYAFQQQYAPQLARFPGLNEELGAAIRARVAENTARGAEGGVLKEIGEQGRGPVAEYLRFGKEKAENAMRGVLSSNTPAKDIDELLTFVGDEPAAVDGARKVFWDILEKDTKSAGSTTMTMSGRQPFLPEKLKNFLEDPAKAAVAARLYRDNPEHLENIQKMAETLRNMNVRSRAKAPNTSGTAQSILPSMETVASRTFAVARGVVSPAFAALNVFGIIARRAVAKNQGGLVNRIVDQALLEPDFMAALLKENNPANRAALKAHAKGWLGNEASTLTQLMQAEDPDEDIKRAAAR